MSVFVVFCFLPVPSPLLCFLLSLTADLEYAWAAPCVLFMASGKSLMQNSGQQSYCYTKVDGKIESQSEFIKAEGETKKDFPAKCH